MSALNFKRLMFNISIAVPVFWARSCVISDTIHKSKGKFLDHFDIELYIFLKKSSILSSHLFMMPFILNSV